VALGRQALAVIDWLDERLRPLAHELFPLADAGVVLLETIPGIGPLLGLTIGTEIGDIARFPSARKLIGYAGLAPTIKQSGQARAVGRCRRPAPRRCVPRSGSGSFVCSMDRSYARHAGGGSLRHVRCPQRPPGASPFRVRLATIR